MEHEEKKQVSPRAGFPTENDQTEEFSPKAMGNYLSLLPPPVHFAYSRELLFFPALGPKPRL